MQSHGLEPARLLCPRDFPGKNTGVGSHSLLQGIFPTQGLNLGLLRWKQILYYLSHQGSLLLTMCMRAKSLQSCLTLCNPWIVTHQLPCPWNSPGKNTGVGSWSLLQKMVRNMVRNIPNPGIEPQSPALQADSLHSEPPGKPRIIAKWG